MLEYVCHRTCLAEAGPTLLQVVHQSLQDSQDEISRSVLWGRRRGGGGMILDAYLGSNCSSSPEYMNKLFRPNTECK